MIQKRDTKAGPRYDVRLRDPAGRTYTRTFRTKKEATRYEAQERADRSRGQWVDPRAGTITFGAWWASWWKSTVNLRPSSRARDESYAANHLLPQFGDVPLAAITHLDVREWVAALAAKGLAPATVQRAYQLLSKALRDAVSDGRLAASPAAGVKLPRVEPTEQRFLNPTEVELLADAMDLRYRDAVTVLAYAGLRISELAGLRAGRVDLLAGHLDVAENAVEVKGVVHFGQPKTRAGRRRVPFGATVRRALEPLVAGKAPDALVVTAPEGGPLRAPLFRRRFWYPAVERAGLSPLRVHDLRHTAVSLWIATGANPKEVAAWAGHSSVATVLDRYGHLFPEDSSRVMDRLDALADAARQVPDADVVSLPERAPRSS